MAKKDKFFDTNLDFLTIDGKEKKKKTKIRVKPISKSLQKRMKEVSK